jgi:hypothetical protein
MRVPALVIPLISLLFACATPQRSRQLAKAVVLPNNMCGQKGVAAASNDPKGDRMICEFEEPVGSHVPRCVCRDEQNIIADRENTQQYLRDMEHGACLNNGSGPCH